MGRLLLPHWPLTAIISPLIIFKRHFLSSLKLCCPMCGSADPGMNTEAICACLPYSTVGVDRALLRKQFHPHLTHPMTHYVNSACRSSHCHWGSSLIRQQCSRRLQLQDCGIALEVARLVELVVTSTGIFQIARGRIVATCTRKACLALCTLVVP